MSRLPPPTRAPRRRVDGVLLLDKPAGISSNAALQRARRLFVAEKAGHTGTLDPGASGLLPICFGEATKFAGYLLDAAKAYRATIRFGITTTTGDAEGEALATRPVDFTRDALELSLARFRGSILQVPPRHAALKFEGRAYYDYARAGVEIPRHPRQVTIHSLDPVSWVPPDLVLDVRCSKGTYVRVLAEDLGEALASGAHLAALRRTATGGFELSGAITLDELEAMPPAERDERLLPPAVLVAALPRIAIDIAAVARFRHGMPVPAVSTSEGVHAVFAGRDLIGVAEVAGGVARPRRLLVAAPDAASTTAMNP